MITLISPADVAAILEHVRRAAAGQTVPADARVVGAVRRVRAIVELSDDEPPIDLRLPRSEPAHPRAPSPRHGRYDVRVYSVDPTIPVRPFYDVRD